jgi:hypothetical protein
MFALGVILAEAAIFGPPDFTNFLATELPSCVGAGDGSSAGKLLLHLFAVFCAVTALGMRTLEEGLQPKRELERYQNYSDDVQEIANHFERGSCADKFQAMIEMEELAYNEMREFYALPMTRALSCNAVDVT